jgi:hypothetical protein
VAYRTKPEGVAENFLLEHLTKLLSTIRVGLDNTQLHETYPPFSRGQGKKKNKVCVATFPLPLCFSSPIMPAIFFHTSIPGYYELNGAGTCVFAISEVVAH